MMARKLGLVAVAIMVAFAGCKPVAPAPTGEAKLRPALQEKAKWNAGKVVTLDEDTLRARLLLLEAVRKDLGLTEGQIADLDRLIKTAKEQGREWMAKGREILPPGNYQQEEYAKRERELRAFTKEQKDKAKELVAKILAVLTPGQRERLKQILLQSSISTALDRPEIIKALDLSKEQRAKLRALRDRLEAKAFAAAPDLHGLDAKQRRQKMIESMKAADKRWADAKEFILDILTPAQRAKFEKLQGKKIDLKWPYEQSIPEDAEFWQC